MVHITCSCKQWKLQLQFIGFNVSCLLRLWHLISYISIIVLILYFILFNFRFNLLAHCGSLQCGVCPVLNKEPTRSLTLTAVRWFQLSLIQDSKTSSYRLYFPSMLWARQSLLWFVPVAVSCCLSSFRCRTFVQPTLLSNWVRAQRTAPDSGSISGFICCGCRMWDLCGALGDLAFLTYYFYLINFRVLICFSFDGDCGLSISFS